jgi:hypothetical protein
MPGLRRRSRKSNKESSQSNTSSFDDDRSFSTIATNTTTLIDQSHSHSNAKHNVTRAAMKHLTFKRMKSSNPSIALSSPPTKTTTKTTTTATSSSTTPLEIIMKEDASEDLNDLQSLLEVHNNDNNLDSNDHVSNRIGNLYNTNLTPPPPLKKEDESKIKRMATRLISGWLMVGTFVGTMYLGHIYMCTLIFLVEVALVS